jgi:hypothetical protein
VLYHPSGINQCCGTSEASDAWKSNPLLDQATTQDLSAYSGSPNPDSTTKKVAFSSQGMHQEMNLTCLSYASGVHFEH